LLLVAYVPGIEFISGSERFVVTVNYRPSESKRMITSRDQIELYGQWSGQFSPDMYHLVYGIARQHYLRNNLL
jgi:hypothetical protein